MSLHTASSLTTGVPLKVDGSVVEDSCWLQPVNNVQHLNTSLKGINLALLWGNMWLHLFMNSACVHRWVIGHTKAKSKMLDPEAFKYS